MESFHLLLQNPHSVSVLKEGLEAFKEMSGLQANAQKSQIITYKAAAQQQSRIQEIMGFSIVLSSLHLHWSSIFILPKGVVKVIEKSFREFLWKGIGSHKVAWENVCQLLTHGGLGIKNLGIMNKALIAKHIWQIATNKQESIWVAWVQQYRLKQHTIWSYNGSEGSWCWKKILKLRNLVRKGVEFKVGDGNSIKLWLDPWLIDGPLATQYPRGPRITGLPINSWLNMVIDRDTWKWPAEFHTDIVNCI
ncbi:putative mitochondrial protein [Sesamum angolense]|uniref:Mitochondrial protein n=1 Tax=Sesamum angolense TaxID=2727404 RepID=A0AAE1W1C5_9LAMI|nr:putative mitochondrial protein [Sesamum angolense]